MVSCRMFMLALHTIWRFCLSKTCGVREYLSGLRAETPCVPPSSKGNVGGFFMPDSLSRFLVRIRAGARPVTKPLAGRAGARIVGTISGTARRPRPINSAVHSATNSTGGSERRRYTPHTTQPPMVHRQLSIHPHTPMYPANRPRAKDNDEPAELPARPTF